jgi:ribosome-associated toxin RatA of RatAB toxin-antitoxin module
MTDVATEHTTIDASPQTCFDVAIDFDSYPEWARGIKEVEVVTRDSQDRGTVVRYRAAAMGRSTTYLLGYDYGDAPGELSWRLLQGDITRKLDGRYVFGARADDPDRTDVAYELEVELVIPLPNFVKRRAEGLIMTAALPELKARVEAVART